MRTVKAAAVQMSPVLYSREGTVDKVVQRIRELGQAGVECATFPETVVPYYPYCSFVQAPYQISTRGSNLCSRRLPATIRARYSEAHRVEK